MCMSPITVTNAFVHWCWRFCHPLLNYCCPHNATFVAAYCSHDNSKTMEFNGNAPMGSWPASKSPLSESSWSWPLVDLARHYEGSSDAGISASLHSCTCSEAL
jgi:hypothetical protein